jgi:glycosyltransferase involved in cell wall biosynthesis
MRVLGLSLDPTIDFRRDPGGKNAGLFAALDRRWGVVGTARPELDRAALTARRLLRFHPDRERWRRRTNLDPGTFAARTAVAERLLSVWEGRYDIVMQLHTLCGPGTRPRRYALHTDANYLLTERHYPEGAPLRGRRRDHYLALEGDVYRRAAWLFPRSEWLRRSFIVDYGCDPARVVAVGGGANLALADLHGRRWDSRTAVFVGLDLARKGGDALLRAWARVRQRVPGARLVMVGATGPAVDGVEWRGHLKDRAAVAAAYAEAAVFVMPSLYEPWGHVFQEAMAAGLPCIGASCCAMPEIIRDGVDGRLVPPGDADALADALVELLGDPAQAEAMGRAGHAAVTAGRTWDHVVDRMAEVTGG